MSALSRNLAVKSATAVALVALATSVEAQSTSQQAPEAIAQTSPDPTEGVSDEIVVTGFRASLNSALNQKRGETVAIDTIVAEDIGKFPDSNLAESMQRLPGVTISRGDAGAGRNISVRGLGAGFTRIRINGLEGSAQTGASDIYSANNSGRSFDFNVFPTEIFTSLAVRKTPSADVEEGSLGATVDLKAPHALDYRQDMVVSATVRGIYNDVSKNVGPRVSGLFAKHFLDDTLGIVGSASYSRRRTREVGYSAVNILPTYVNGGFCSPLGYTPQNPAPSAANAFRGVTAANCSTNNPRTGTVAAYQTIIDSRGPSGLPGGGVFLPRIPRFFNSVQDEQRLGGTLGLQWKPTDRTEIALDGIYTRYKVDRRDSEVAAQSFARNINDNGQPMTSVRDIQVDGNGSLIYGLFDGVDLRASTQVDHYTTSVAQGTFFAKHELSDTLQIDGIAGYSESKLDNPRRSGISADGNDARNYSIDFRDGGTVPEIGYGIDVTDPKNFITGPRFADGNVNGVVSDQKTYNKTVNQTYELNGTWSPVDGFSFKLGGQWRESDFRQTRLNIVPSQTATPALPAGTTLADITYVVDGMRDIFGRGPEGIIAIDQEKWRQAVNYAAINFCGVECAASASQVRERITSGYLMVNFDTKGLLPLTVRGDAGVRYVHTNQFSVGYAPVAAPAGAQFPNVGRRAEFNRDYEDWLPSMNVVAELQDNLLLRGSAARVLARAELGALAGTSTVGTVTRTATVNNPLLDPIRADTLDGGVEWYFAPGSLISVAYFYKKIESYVQSITSLVPYTTLGLPNRLLDNSPASPNDLFTVTRLTNTPGGPLKGVEVNLQVPLRFLPSFLTNLGLLANYTRVTSKIDYVLQSINGVPTLTTTADLIGLSKNTASGTLYYEDKKFSIRSTANFRDKYIRAIPSGANDSDIQGNRSTLYVDASASYNIMDNLQIIVEATNLTNERNKLYIDSVRKDPLYETTIGRTITIGANVKF